ncbi:MAG: DUF1517 domain-containing protein [Geitlerinemataceae cyanobacterium]
MSGFGDRWNKMTGKTRFLVCRVMLHLAGNEIAPLLGILNQAGRNSIEAEGDLEVMGEDLVEICQQLLQYETYWQSAANEGDVFWSEEEAGDFVNELFTDSAQRYLSQPNFETSVMGNEPFSLPITQNAIVMITIAAEGEVPDLETDLSNLESMEYGLKAIINLNYKQKLRAIQVHFSPAQLGDELTSEQVLMNFPELIPL